MARVARLARQAVASASPVGTADATVAVARDAAGIDPDARQFRAAVCVRVERAAVSDRQASAWLPDSGTPAVEATADALMVVPVAPEEP